MLFFIISFIACWFKDLTMMPDDVCGNFFMERPKHTRTFVVTARTISRQIQIACTERGGDKWEGNERRKSEEL